jgi:hypothetical protein
MWNRLGAGTNNLQQHACMSVVRGQNRYAVFLSVVYDGL